MTGENEKFSQNNRALEVSVGHLEEELSSMTSQNNRFEENNSKLEVIVI